MRVEKHFASLAHDMGLLIRKVAKTRNRSDAMAQTVQLHAESEEGSMKQSLCALAECFAALEDYRQVLVDRLEAKVHRPLLNFDGVCRKAKVRRVCAYTYMCAMHCMCVSALLVVCVVYIYKCRQASVPVCMGVVGGGCVGACLLGAYINIMHAHVNTGYFSLG